MAKILKNTTASVVVISDVGQSVPASGQLTVDPSDYDKYAGSSNIVSLVGAGTLVVNDGFKDLSISAGVDLLKGAFPATIAVTGSAAVGSTPSNNPVSISGVDGGGLKRYILTDAAGRVQTAAQASIVLGVPTLQFIAQNAVNAGFSLLSTYTATAKTAVKQFYCGGTGIGKQALFTYVPTTVTTPVNGGFESTGEVSAWTAISPGTAPVLTYSATTVYAGSGSAQVTFAQSDSTHYPAIKQTLATPLDLTFWRTVTAQFYNTVSTGGTYTRTASVILYDSAGNTRKYDVSGLSNAAPFNASNWIKISGDVENPTSITGSAFDTTNVTAIELRMTDSNNRAGTVYWDAVQFEGALTPVLPIYHQANSSFNLSIDPVLVLNTGDKILVVQKNLDTARKEYFALIGGVAP